jgi:serine/threonine-protein kinase RsbT
MVAQAGGEVAILIETDIVSARRAVREAASAIGFGLTDVTRIVTAASELARNVYKYGGSGVMRWKLLKDGIELAFVDEGPGIADIEMALTQGFTTGGGLGMGLPGARRLMDEIVVESSPGRGTTVIVRKWKKV